MKKLILVAITLVSMTWVSYAGNSSVTIHNAYDGNIMSIEKDKPHSKEYMDLKPFIDKFDEAIKKAKSCEDIEDATIELLLDLFTLSEVEYTEDEMATEEEEKELNTYLDRIDERIKKLQKQWNCPVEEEE